MVARKVWSQPPWSQPVVQLMIEVPELQDHEIPFEILNRRVQGTKRVVPSRKVKLSEASFDVRHSGLYTAKKAENKSINRGSERKVHASKAKVNGKEVKSKVTKCYEFDTEKVSLKRLMIVIDEEMEKIKKNMNELKSEYPSGRTKSKKYFIKEVNEALANIKKMSASFLVPSDKDSQYLIKEMRGNQVLRPLIICLIILARTRRKKTALSSSFSARLIGNATI